MKEEEMEQALLTYQTKRDELNDRYLEQQQQGEMTQRQQDAWVPLQEIQDFIGRMNNNVKELKLSPELSTGDKQLIQDRFMVKFWTTYPLRNDLANTRVLTRAAFSDLSDEDTSNNNYIIVSPQTMMLHVANYKTKKTYGVKKIRVKDKTVIKYLRDWMKVSPNPDYALVNLRSAQPMTAIQITQNFLRIFEAEFGKRVSTTLLRHIVVTDTFGQVIQDMDAMADVMCHSKSTQHLIYSKPSAVDTTVSA
jgi:hypothetical protein